jgi:hypothetical protein
VKRSLYLIAQVLPGNRIEIQAPTLSVGQTVEVIVLVSEDTVADSSEEQSLSLEQRLAFLKLPLAERRVILASQAETILPHYQQDSQWQELMAGDIIDY